MSVDLSWLKPMTAPSGSTACGLGATAFTASTVCDQVGAGALGDLDGDRRLAVDPGDGLGVLEGRADRGEVAGAHHGVRRRRPPAGSATSSAVSISDGILIA